MEIMDKAFLRCVCYGLMVSVLSILPAPEAIAKEPSREREALRRIQIQLNEINRQKSVLEQEKAALSEEVETLKKGADRLTSSLSKGKAHHIALEKELDAVRKEKEALSEKLQETVKNLQDMTRSHAEVTQALQNVQAEKEQEKRQFEAAVSRLSGQVQVCETKNIKLYQLNVEMMNKYRARSVMGAVLENEPFTQLKSVEAENLLEEYRDKADAAKIAPSLSR